MFIIRTLAAVLAIAAVAVPTAQAKFVDIHQPLIETSTSAPLDYSRNSVSGEYLPKADKGGVWDRRNPDTVDAANGRGPSTAPRIAVVKVPTPAAPATSPSGDGLDWTDAGIGAGGMLAMIALAGAGAVAVTHRRRGLEPAA